MLEATEKRLTVRCDGCSVSHSVPVHQHDPPPHAFVRLGVAIGLNRWWCGAGADRGRYLCADCRDDAHPTD